MPNLLEVKGLDVTFRTRTRLARKQTVHALQNVSLTVPEKSRYGIAGESGSGKSTLAKTIVGLLKPTSGEIYLQGEKIRDATSEPKILPTRIQIVFQDPYGSLDPRLRIIDSMVEPLKSNKMYLKGNSEVEVQSLFEQVGLRSEILTRFPHELSGGQRQRVSIARAILMKPELLIFDEPTSSLDLSTQAQVAKLIRDIASNFDFTYIFITHNLELIWYMCDMICVMRQGRVVEVNDKKTIFENPQDPYTQELISAVTMHDSL